MALMSLTSSNITTYMSQWLATATNGNVTSDFAADMMQMTLVCKECGARLEVDRPESAEKIDYSLQEYVKLHRHQGGHANANQKLKELNAEIEKINTELKAKKIQKYQKLMELAKGLPTGTDSHPKPIPKPPEPPKPKPLSKPTGRKFR